eukprot:UN06758
MGMLSAVNMKYAVCVANSSSSQLKTNDEIKQQTKENEEQKVSVIEEECESFNESVLNEDEIIKMDTNIQMMDRSQSAPNSKRNSLISKISTMFAKRSSNSESVDGRKNDNCDNNMQRKNELIQIEKGKEN